MYCVDITPEVLLANGFKSAYENYYHIPINDDSYVYCNQKEDGWDIGIATKCDYENDFDEETIIPLQYIYIYDLLKLVELLTLKYEKEDDSTTDV